MSTTGSPKSNLKLKPKTSLTPKTSSIDAPRNILTISDIHLGHKGTPSNFILRNLKAFFNDFRTVDNFDDLKMILIAGDLWHEAITFGAEHIPDIVTFWHHLCGWCQHKGIKLRLMKGTPYHDGNQGKSLESLTLSSFPKLDFKYVDTLSIEKVADMDLSILYVPDECRPSAVDTYRDVQMLLYDEGLEKVDVACMHGMFTYQLGTIPMNHKVHDERLYLDLVRYFITIGHIHTASVYERIFAQGSFDRIAHNEEGDKGAFYFMETEKNSWEPIFLVNKGAKIYKTVEIKKSTQDALGLVDKIACGLPDFSHLRIVAEEGHEILQGLTTLAKKYPALFITRKKVSPKKEAKKSLISKSYTPLSLNRGTLTEAVMGEVHVKHELSPDESKQLFNLLENLHT
jgi:hypothetical protein